MPNNNDHYDLIYLPKIVRMGKWTYFLAVIMVLIPPAIVTWGFKIVPDRTALFVAVVAHLSINGIWAVIEPVSFFPVLGVPGTYLAFLSGNIGNLRIPCATAALKATNTKIGTKEASIISSIGMSASVIVNIVLLIIGVFLGSRILGSLPDKIRESLAFLLPAMFGALLMQFAVDDIKSGVVAMLLSCGSLLIYNAGGYDWFPIDPFIPNMLIPIFGTMLFARLTYRSTEEKNEQNEEAPAG